MDLLDSLLILWFLFNLVRTKGFKEYLPPRPLLITLGLWFTSVTISALTNLDKASPRLLQGVLEFRWMLSFLALVALWQMIDLNSEKVKTYIASALGLNFIISISMALIQNDPRPGGLIGPMAMAHNLALIIPVFFYWLFDQNLKPDLNFKSWSRSHFLVAIALISAGLLLIMTKTRGPWLGLAISMLLSFYFLEKKWRMRLFAGSIFAIVILLIAVPSIRQRLQHTGASDFSSVSRAYFWEGNLSLWKKNPLFGVGYGMNNGLYFNELSAEKQNYILSNDPGLKVAHAHNQYIHFLSGTGCLGLLGYFILLALIIKPSLKSLYKKHEYINYNMVIGIQTGLTAFLIASATEANFSIAKNRLFFLILAAALIVLTQKRQQQT